MSIEELQGRSFRINPKEAFGRPANLYTFGKYNKKNKTISVSWRDSNGDEDSTTYSDELTLQLIEDNSWILEPENKEE